MTEKPLKTNQEHLVIRNVRIHNRRTSMRLSEKMWDALQEISKENNCSIHDICSAVDESRTSAFTTSVRDFVLDYYRNQQDSLPMQIIREKRSALKQPA